MAEKNLGEFLTSALVQRRSSDLLLYRVAGEWRKLPAGDVERQVRELAVGLLAYGAEPDARVALFAEDRPEALIADLAIHTYGGTVVPIAPGSSSASLRQSLATTEARLVLVSGTRQLERVLEARPDLPLLDLVLLFERPEGETAVASALVDSARSLGSAQLAEDPGLFEAALRGAQRGGGTWLTFPADGADPDVLALTPENLIQGTEALEPIIDVGARDVVLSLLPVTRAAHRTFQYAALRRGAQLAFATSLQDLAAARPTIVIAERELVESLARRLLADVEARRWLGRAGVRWALRNGARKIRADLAAGRFPSPGPWILRVADRLALHGLRRRLVGGRLRFIVSLGLPLDPEIFEILEACGLPILEGYDLDEVAGMIAMETPLARNPGTVGRPVSGLETRIASDGELQVRGPMVGRPRGRPRGSPSGTDGWLGTGRSARIQEGGWLVPTS